MSKTARLLAAAFVASVLSFSAAPLATTAHAASAASAKDAIGWDVSPAHDTVTPAGAPAGAIGWD
ncbi:hypothetical protein [Streptomyces sp. NPDC093225]|uniref:hypothetical protein n=1 Tax=Streptomyces sp. NPDC093225 TaxID=3366034 RepID=UPI00380DDE8C